MVNLKIGRNLSSSKTSPLAFSSGKKNCKICSVLISAFLIYLIATGVVSAPAMAAYMYASDASDGYLKKINQTTGGVEDVGSIGAPGEVRGLSAGPSSNILYGAEISESKLWTINVGTGVGTEVGAFGYDVQELAYDPVNKVLYGTDFSKLYTVDQNSGEATEVGPFGSNITQAWALDYDIDTGYIYGVDAFLLSEPLFWADISTGEATFIGGTGRDDVTDIAFDRETGVLYGIEMNKAPDYFFTINKGTGATTNIGPMEDMAVEDSWVTVKGLAKPIPEPTTFLLLGSGLLGLIGLVRKRSGRA